MVPYHVQIHVSSLACPGRPGSSWTLPLFLSGLFSISHSPQTKPTHIKLLPEHDMFLRPLQCFSHCSLLWNAHPLCLALHVHFTSFSEICPWCAQGSFPWSSCRIRVHLFSALLCLITIITLIALRDGFFVSCPTMFWASYSQDLVLSILVTPVPSTGLSKN